MQKTGGPGEGRTPDPLVANQILPVIEIVRVVLNASYSTLNTCGAAVETYLILLN
jgi:hypothetical protein